MKKISFIISICLLFSANVIYAQILYGTTSGGGLFNSGTITEYNVATNKLEAKVSLGGNNYQLGSGPVSEMTQGSDGRLYGVMHNGGANGLGVIFSFDPATSISTVLYNFDNANGGNPQNSLMQAADGKFYGTTYIGGLHSYGVIFSFDPFTSVYKKLYDFVNTDGTYASTKLVQLKDGKLYGTMYDTKTTRGGRHRINNYPLGTIFSFDPITLSYNRLYTFDYYHGIAISSFLQGLDGKLYGACGGSVGTDYYQGIIFSFDPLTSICTVVYNFNYRPEESFGNPIGRIEIIQASDGKFYGKSSFYGEKNHIFSYDLMTSTYKDLYDIDSYRDVTSFVEASNGKFYGNTYGNTYYQENYASIFSFDPASSVYTPLIAYNRAYDNYPVGSFTEGKDIANTNNTAIVTSPLGKKRLVFGGNVDVSYTASGNYGTGNVFVAQLSDLNGDFTAAVTIGTVVSAASGTIYAVIPVNTPAGSGYRIRVVSANPMVTGSDNGSDITVGDKQLASLTAPADITISLACGEEPISSTLPFDDGSGISNPSTFTPINGTNGRMWTETWTATNATSVSRTVTVWQNMGAVQSFVFFSGEGAVSNTGGSTITGDVGSNDGAVSGFDAPFNGSGSVITDPTNTTQAKIDLLNLYIHLSNIPITAITPTTPQHAAVFGSGETIMAGVYSIAGAGSMAGELTIDGGSNSNSLAIIKFNGAFSPAAGSTIHLINGMKASNVFWIAEGAISIGATSTMKGTFIAHTGAATMAAGGDLEGRLLSTVGVVAYGPGNAYLPSDPSDIPIIPVSTCDNSSTSILGSVANFALFSSAGAVSNTGSTGIIGSVGSDAGAITGFGTPSTTLVGITYNGDAKTAKANKDLLAGYTTLVNTNNLNKSHAPVFGNETLTPGVYSIAGAGSLTGTLTLDGGSDANATFIFKFGGAFTSDAQSKIILTNGTNHCNVYWVAEGAISLGTLSFMKGYFIANNGANTMGANSNLEGSMYSTAGAIGVNTSVAYNGYIECTDPVKASTGTSTSNNAAIAQSMGLTTLANNGLTIYPNPNKGVLHLDYSGDKSLVRSIDICDMLGKHVFYADRYQPVIYLNNHAAGLYVVKVCFGSKMITSKVFIGK